jgi:mRNA interferase RelE/StbE
MSCEVKLHPAAIEDLQALDGRLRLIVAKQLLKFQENLLAGKELGKRAGIDLTGYRKLYLDNRRIRIVYQYQQAVLVVFVISIGKRENLLAYLEAARRVQQG